MIKKLRGLSLPTRIMAVIYLITWLAGPILLLTGYDRNGLLYGVVFLCVLFPAETFLFSIWAGTRDITARHKWLVPIVFGAGYVLNGICVMPSALLHPVVYLDYLRLFLIVVVISAIGLMAGLGIKRFAQAVRNRKGKYWYNNGKPPGP